MNNPYTTQREAAERRILQLHHDQSRGLHVDSSIRQAESNLLRQKQAEEKWDRNHR